MAKNDKSSPKDAPAPKPVKDLPVRKTEADKVKGGAASAGHEKLR